MGYTHDTDKAKKVFKADGWCIDKSELKVNIRSTFLQGLKKNSRIC